MVFPCWIVAATLVDAIKQDDGKVDGVEKCARDAVHLLVKARDMLVVVVWVSRPDFGVEMRFGLVLSANKVHVSDAEP